MATKKTPTQKYIDIAAKKAAEAATKGASLENCQLTGVHYDAKAVNAIDTIAQGLVENAKALGTLAKVLNASHVKIDTLIRIDSAR